VREQVDVRVLRISTTMVALSYTGFADEFSREIARRLGVADIEWVVMPFDKLFSSDHPPFDMAAQFVTITPERRAVVDLSDPYIHVDQGLLAVAGSPITGAKTVEAVRGYVLGGRADGTGMACVREMIRPNNAPKEYPSAFSTAKAVTSGEIDGAVLDAPLAIALEKQFPETTVVGRFGTNEEYGILFEKGSPLREHVNRALSEMEGDGWLARLVERWFPGLEQLPLLA
jgi:polar amino acid transport system substrate-binding protein